MEEILIEIRQERERQNEKFGEQNHPILYEVIETPDLQCKWHRLPTERDARDMVELHEAEGDLTYMNILVEEISEAASCTKNKEELRKELIQIAAVSVAMIESLDRNGR